MHGCDSYDAEMAARVEAWQLGVERGAKRALILMDATSPVLASRKFRRLTARARSRRRRDVWLGSLTEMYGRRL